MKRRVIVVIGLLFMVFAIAGSVYSIETFATFTIEKLQFFPIDMFMCC